MRGKVFTDSICTVQNKDHPRLCGEKCHLKRRLAAQKGSPPPMRGKVLVLGLKVHVTRITPAYAGKSDSDAV